MTRSALIIGGTGQIGSAVGRRLAAEGWQVTLAQRGLRPSDGPSGGARRVAFDREAPNGLTDAINGGVDAIIDTVAYDEPHARSLLEVQADVGAYIVISSASVYRDATGRSLDEADKGGFPDLSEPIPETQATVAAGPETYSTRKVALEQALLQLSDRPVTIVRPCAIHGPGSHHPREWFFVKRILDGRRLVPLAFDGESRFHTSATANIAELIAVALKSPRTQILNAADPEALSVRAIGKAIARNYDHELSMAPFAGPPAGAVGSSPWGVPRPFVVDMSRAHALGYQPVTTYQNAVGEACRSAEAMWRRGIKFPAYLTAMFDYAAEDAFLARREPV